MLTNEKYLQMYFDILRIRIAEEKIADNYHFQEMRCPVHLSIGQEATPVGICHALSPKDKMVSTHRAHAHYLAKGGSLFALYSELYGRETGCAKGRGGSMHLIDLNVNFEGSTSIVSSTIPVGVGLAFGEKYFKNKNTISVVCFGDTAVEEGVFHEAANFASLHKLPVFFMLENNYYSCYSPLSNRQPKRSFEGLAKAHDLNYFEADGNDVFDVYTKFAPFVTDLREGKGPVLGVFETYRHLEHCGPNNDDKLGYRPKEEVDKFLKNDPVFLAENFLTEKNILNTEIKSTYREIINNEVDVEFSKARDEAPNPLKEELGKYIYAE